MPDDRKLLAVLKAELLFLEKGGYRHPIRQAWRAPLVFADSPTCMNFMATPEQRRPCSDCVLIELVPPDHRKEKLPCHHLPLTEIGDTLEHVYHWGTQEEAEDAVGRWLQAT